MSSILNRESLTRYKDVVSLLLRYGGREFIEHSGLGELLESNDIDAAATKTARAEQLADDLEQLGPTFVKLGQLLSSRADMLPAAYRKSLSRLHDEVDPFDIDDVKRIITEELGVGPDAAFVRFDRQPLAAASLGQVHRAQLADGREVVVKVQRPGVDDVVQTDLTVIHQVARLMHEHSEFGQRYHLLETVQQFRKHILRELDYTREADNLRTLGRNMRQFEHVVVPEPIDRLTSPRVLTMTWLDAENVNDIEPSRLRQLADAGLADQLFEAYLNQVLRDGFFHADPHPGNVCITAQGQVGFIDLGMVGFLDDATRDQLLHLLLAVGEGRSDDAADLAVNVGDRTDVFDPPAFRQGLRDTLAEHRDQSLHHMQVGQLLLDVAHVAGDTGLRIPPPIMVLGKALMNLDQIGRTLDPDFDANEAIRRHTARIMRHRSLHGLSPGQLFTNLMEIKQFVGNLPRRVDRILDNLADNELKLNVNAIDEQRLITGIEKIANRVTVGLVLAALIVGGALLMNVDTDFTILGYPGLAMILFFTSAALGFVFITKIWLTDLREHRQHRRNR